MKKIIFLTLALLTCVCVFPQSGIKRPDSYNYNRGLDEFKNENYDEALEYFQKEVSADAKNGYAYSWMALIYQSKEEYGMALTSVNNALKYIPKKDASFLAATYIIRADTYLGIKDTLMAINDYGNAIKINPSNEDAYENRAQIYYVQGKYDLANADYRQLIKLDEGGVMGYMGLGRNLNAQERWDEAIAQFNHVAAMYSDYSSTYSFRAEAYLGKKQWAEATDDILKALVISGDNKAFYMMQELEEPAFGMLKAKLKIQSTKEPNKAYWPHCIAVMHEHKEEYLKAIPFYKEANSKDANDVFLRRIAQCYYQAGEYKDALTYIEKAISLDSTKAQYIPLKANILYEMGNVKDAITEWDKHQTLYPDYGFGYYRRGWFKEMLKDYDGAIEDLTLSVTLDPDASYSYVTRGDIYLKIGKEELAKLDFQKAIEIEDSPEKYDFIHYAYHGLGDDARAIAAMDTIIARNPDDSKSNYYDAACLYSRMKNKEKALEYLELSLKNGYKRFAHIRNDYDMDFIRETPEFKRIMETYEKKASESSEDDATSSVSDQVIVSEIPFTKENGVCNVKCKINELPLYFVFDTGASTVSLSMVEANFMMKNGYLSKKDVIGSSLFEDANGNINEGSTLNIRKVEFGELKLENVKASVVKNQRAPLLLGQSVLSRLGKIEIDNTNHLLKISHSTK